MDRINELLARLGDLNAEELDELSQLLAEEVTAALPSEGQRATAEQAETLQALADAQDSVNAEVAHRDEEQAAVEARVAEQVARLRPAAEADTDEDDDDAEGGDEGGADDEAPADAPTGERQPVAASASRPPLSRLATRTRDRAPRTPAPEAARHTIVNASTGRAIAAADIATVMAAGIDAGRHGRSSTPRSLVSTSIEFPATRMLSKSGTTNESLIASAETAGQDAGSLVAAGGLCAPIPNLYDIEVIGTDARPLRDALTVFGADRGGVSLRQSIRSEDVAGGIGSWTLADDAAVGTGAPEDDPTKPIVDVVCPGFDDFYVEAVTARMRFSNVTSRFDPEGTAANVTALRNLQARVAEQKLLNGIYAYSTTVTGGAAVSATRDILVGIDKISAYYRNHHRLGDTEVLWIVLPRWVRDLIRADLTRGATEADALNVANATIDAFFTNRNLRVTWQLDGRTTAGINPAVSAQQYAGALIAGGTIPGFFDQVEYVIARPNDFLFLDGGQIDLGTVRDSGLNAQNRYELFFETFEGVAFRGVEAVRVVQTVQPTGQSAAPVNTSALTD